MDVVEDGLGVSAVLEDGGRGALRQGEGILVESSHRSTEKKLDAQRPKSRKQANGRNRNRKKRKEMKVKVKKGMGMAMAMASMHACQEEGAINAVLIDGKRWT